ncbi:MAG: type III-A CRISPR-associated protein Cas10/Csm1 [Candidatus Desulfofervidaceae bacterium]|nr:type III-A CRISPR-associated protein Cas10/Csm1 [Candidatus Desulfofervidaceae bacterium]
MKLIDKISLAALLHDIGKFYQRTGVELQRPNNWSDYIPSEYSYLHALYTYQFFDEFEDIFKDSKQTAETALINLASRHHKPSNPYESIIAFADHLSSGLDRKHYDALQQEKDIKKFRRVRLKPIFEEIRLEKHDYTNEKFLYPLRPFSPENIFPKEKSFYANLTDEKAKQEYKELWESFIADFKKIRHTSFDNFFNAIKSLLELYTWCIPSATIKTIPDVSLYDHLTTTAAIATSLFRYYEAKNLLEKCTLNYLGHNREQSFIFIAGDFSGIQRFIFDRGGSANKYAAKILRAKSFFVSIATEIAAYMVVQAFGLNPASIISTAAGKFLILAPNLDHTDILIQELKEKISNAFHKRFYGEVNFSIAYLKAGTEVFDVQHFAPFMNKLSLKLEEAKLKPLPLDAKLFVFNDYLEKIKSSEDVCAICAKRPMVQIMDEMPVCKDCLSFKKMGERFVKENFIKIGQGLKYPVIGKFGFEFAEKDTLDENSGDVLIYQLTEGFYGYPLKYIARYVPTFEKDEWQEKKYKRLEKEKLPKEQEAGAIKTFFHLACDALTKEDGQWIGSRFLGVLKADVDNLGLIFREGLKRKEGHLLTISRYAYLSRMLDAFFSLYIREVVAKKYPDIYTVFTGGDDLFLIGPYTQIYEFAKEEVGRQFKKYVCQNEDITISAGLILSKPAVPVREMAEEAENMLEQSKDKGKNAISMFDKTLSWQEFLKLFEFEMEINTVEEVEKLPTSYFYRLLAFADWAEKAHQNPKFAKWRALFAYITARNFGEKNYYERLLSIADEWIERYKSKLIIPLSIAIYRRRK